MQRKNVWKIAYYIVLVFIVAVALLLIVSVFPIPGNYKVMTVLSGSMEPTIKMGSVVVVKPAKDYKVGDIITFGPYSKTKPSTTHRIYEIKNVNSKKVYITKGDANNAPDNREVRKEDILGKVIFSVPYFGYLASFAQKPYGFATLIIIPAILIIADQIKVIVKEIKKRRGG